MRMEVHIYSVKAKNQVGNVWAKDIYDNIKRPKPQGTQLGVLKIHAFCRKIQQRPLGPVDGAAGVTQYLSLKIHPKS